MWDDLDDDLLFRRPSRTPRPAGPEDLAATIALTVVLIAVGAVLWFGVLLQQLGVAACGAYTARCDYALLEFAAWLTPIATLVAVAFTVVALARRPIRRRRTWWAPVVGLLFTVAVFAVASLLISTALHPVD